jgi:hypothetical protein
MNDTGHAPVAYKIRIRPEPVSIMGKLVAETGYGGVTGMRRQGPCLVKKIANIGEKLRFGRVGFLRGYKKSGYQK